MASFSVPLLSICRGKLHRQVHVCDLLISYVYGCSSLSYTLADIPAELERNTTGQTSPRIRSRAAAYIGSGNETAMEVSASDLGSVADPGIRRGGEIRHE